MSALRLLNSDFTPVFLSCGSLLVSLLAACALFASLKNKERGSFVVYLSLFVVIFVYSFAAYHSLCALRQSFFSPALLSPGFFPTREFTPAISASLRRLLDPSVVLLMLSLHLLSLYSKRRVASFCFALCLWALVAAVLLESFFLVPDVLAWTEKQSLVKAFSFLHFLAVRSGLALLILALGFSLSRLAGFFSQKELSAGIWRRPLVLLAVFSLGSGFILLLQNAHNENYRALVGAHYYSWFPENWKQGRIGRVMDPAISPLLGEYASKEKKVFESHLSWASQAGIDFFVFDWWPRRPLFTRRVLTSVSETDWPADFRFAVHYESLDLREPHEPLVEGESGNILYLSEKRIWRLKKHWEFIAKKLMSHPNYLRFEGKPVLFVYVTRHLIGPVPEAIVVAREHVLKTTGIELYLVADEAYYNVVDHKSHLLKPKQAVNWERLSVFDAITAYNPVDPLNTAHGGEGGVERFISDVKELYGRYKGAAAVLGQKFIPTVVPGYNDRGVRRYADHPGAASKLWFAAFAVHF